MDGLSKIDALVEYAKSLGMESLALTDHGVMYGAIEFYKKATSAGIKPIIGCEIYLANNTRHDKRSGIDDKRHHLILLAKNTEGYKNLLKIVSKAHLEGFYYKPRADKELLRQYSKGLIAMSACLGGEIPRAIHAGHIEKAEKLALEYQEIFGKGNFYLEIQPHPNLEGQDSVNNELIKISKKTGIPLVATNDSHYLKKEDAEAQDILLAVQTSNFMDDEDRLTMKMEDFSLKPTEEMISSFERAPEAIENTKIIADSCNLKIEIGKIQLPHFKVPGGYTPQTYLKELCFNGLKKRYDINPEDIENPKDFIKSILDRLDFELSVIEKMGYEPYFLIVQDFVNWAKSNGIVVGPGRGSAAGSIVAYLTNITNIDPIKYELLFERFLNPDRISMPDIDLDFADTRRQEVLNYISQKYGQDKVAQIITFGTMAARAAIRDAGRALGYTYDFCDQLAKLIPLGSNLKEALETPEFKNQYNNDAQAKKLIDSAIKLEGVVRHASTHACGIVITKDPLIESVPLQNAAQDGNNIIVTQYEMHAIEDLGLLKMDILGLKNLTIIENTLNLIEKNHGVKIDIDKLPLDDKKTYKLFQNGKTTGVFQFESDGMKRYLKELKPTEFEDLIAMVALYRPGPMELIPSFIARKHGKEKIEYLYPALETILKNTHGIAVYQEQIMEMAKQIAKFTPGQADTLRKAIGKKIHKLLLEQQEVFMQGCLKNGVPKAIAQKLADLLEPFSRYGFNRSHAACYALVAYQTAYLKANYQNEFMSALLTAEIGDIERAAFLIDECKSLGIDVLPPDINESFSIFNTTGPNTIRFGLTGVKNVGKNIVQAIIDAREKEGRFTDIEDFINKVKHKDLNKKSLESLIRCGALDSLEERKQLLESIDILLNYSREAQKSVSSGQDSLFSNLPIKDIEPSIKLKNSPPATKEEKLGWEKELLGLYVSDHPLNEHKDYLAKISVPFAKLAGVKKSEEIITGGLVLEIKKILTKSNESMLFVKIEDLSGKSEIIVFPRVLKETEAANIWQPGAIILVKGKVSDKDGQFKIIANKAKILEKQSLPVNG
ncbi:MAG: polymerase III catalytic subunit, DnaE type protein [Parcubacteria group bacterium GW2011_GWD2_38_12]|nr:MAG: polymerase III catalytic subunit, DnaE type protein [Parcubacteria group bacterium GW2011_GWC2_36_17]KKQ52921.1 MAG: polymerase III catalytic subunit, DnaE type protein [Parcubacteria group bacterium GW2011_GWD2_38_12]KKQ59739.1 MAG: polymerase III catalytic subunit, DnaE type protein [Parcubacteria group bacterium GW2011_GWD1_38_16]